ncbi:asparagine synthase-related protein, partial [Sphingobium estronivorans]|uniref:asparagine synthase-related protein n=1 Tax=Sphingobium estronivorans TaxID=1577690 RepID=UPI001F081080
SGKAGALQTLFEERYALEDVDLDQSSIRHLPKPFGRLDLQAYDAAMLRVAKQFDARAIFTGNGGDNVFYMSHSARPLADRLLSNGWSLGLLKTVSDISTLTGANGVEVILHGIRAWRRSADGYVWKSELGFLMDSVVDELASKPVYHPWLEQPESLKLPAKAAQIAMLIRMHHSLDAYRERDGMPVFHPLASQPLLETCLQIPAWLQCDQGVDRSVARRAFRAALPDVVVDRKTKGGPQGFSFQIFYRFRDEIKERLMNGFLAGEKIVDRVAIEAAFDPDIQPTVGDVTRLLMLVDTEAWVRHWRSMRVGRGLNAEVA